MSKSPFKTPNIVAEVNYGSIVYGTNDEHSDTDIICIVNHIQTLTDPVKLNNIDFKVINNKDFQILLDEHDISAIECYFLSQEHILRGSVQDNFTFTVNLGKLRNAFSQKSSNSWVKCKKKLTVEEGEERIGMKSLFHSLRIMDFGIQLASTGKIENFGSANHYLKEIYEIGPNWELLNQKFKPIYNKLHSEFKKVAIKETNV